MTDKAHELTFWWLSRWTGGEDPLHVMKMAIDMDGRWRSI